MPGGGGGECVYTIIWREREGGGGEEREREKERERGRERGRGRKGWSEREIISTITHSIDRSGHVYVNPDAWEVKAEMSSNEETSTGALRITAILQ